MDAVINKLDEAPWVERFSVYGAVENKRDIENRTGSSQTITIDGASRTFAANAPTPAGEVYRDLHAKLAYNPAVEFIPIYPTFKKPATTFNTNFLISSGQVRIMGKDENGEYFDSVRVDKKVGTGQWTYVTSAKTIPSYGLIAKWDATVTEPVTYKLSYFYCNETAPRFSDEASIDLSIATPAPARFGKVTIARNDASNVIYTKFPAKTAIPVLGAASNVTLYSGTNLFVPTIGDLDSATFRINAVPYGYLYDYNKTTLESLAFTGSAEVPYLLVDSTETSLGEMSIESGIVGGVKDDWVVVQFKNPFAEAPLVFPTVLTSANYTANSAPVVARVRNITATGFELRLTREGKITKAWVAEKVAYAAIPVGDYIIPYTEGVKNKDLHIVAGLTAANLAATARQHQFTTAFPVVPSYILSLQTSGDDWCSTLSFRQPAVGSIRYQKIGEQSKEIAPTYGNDQVGFLAIYVTDNTIGVPTVTAGEGGLTLVQDGASIQVKAAATTFTLYAVDGTALLTAPVGERIEIGFLPTGSYIIRTTGGASIKFVKQ
jgi:hypothetical protein